ncbi:hypothetical protein OAP56_04615, partial [Rickettsiaceae bacterium]|nr:hypothetical protein [Rickettsiaceae bacterium]
AKETMKLDEKCNSYNDKLSNHNTKYKSDGVGSIPKKKGLERGNLKPSVGGNRRESKDKARH